MSDRKIIFQRLILAFALGIAYYVWIKLTNLSIPCPLRLISGDRILCPSCGVTTMCVNIIEGNFKAAFEANPCIFILTPLWLVFIGVRLIFQPKACSDGKPLNQIIYYILAGVLVIFGVLRNINFL